MQINSFNHFRAIAIIFIIAGHSFGIVGMEFDTLLEASIRNIIKGGTSLFVFISGLLFHHVFYQKYHYKNFFIKKCNHVLVPYLILGFIPTTLQGKMTSDFISGIKSSFHVIKIKTTLKAKNNSKYSQSGF